MALQSCLAGWRPQGRIAHCPAAVQPADDRPMGLRLSGDFLNHMTKIKPTRRPTMLNMLKSLLNEIKKNGLFPMFSHRNIVIVGFIVLITYLFGIDYYPTNISIETGITIFLISYISGALYITLWSAIISLGWGVFYLVNKYIPSKKTCLLEMIGETLKIDLADHEEKKPRAIFALAFLVYLIFSTKWWMSILVITASTVVYGAIVMLTFVIKTQNKP